MNSLKTFFICQILPQKCLLFRSSKQALSGALFKAGLQTAGIVIVIIIAAGIVRRPFQGRSSDSSQVRQCLPPVHSRQLSLVSKGNQLQHVLNTLCKWDLTGGQFHRYGLIYVYSKHLQGNDIFYLTYSWMFFLKTKISFFPEIIQHWPGDPLVEFPSVGIFNQNRI